MNSPEQQLIVAGKVDFLRINDGTSRAFVCANRPVVFGEGRVGVPVGIHKEAAGEDTQGMRNGNAGSTNNLVANSRDVDFALPRDWNLQVELLDSSGSIQCNDGGPGSINRLIQHVQHVVVIKRVPFPNPLEPTVPKELS